MSYLKTLALVAVASVAGLAQTPTPATAPSNAHFFLDMGIGFGGDTLATVGYDDGTTKSIKAGNGFLFKAGVDVRVSKKVAIVGSIGYETDSANAENGSLSFTRVPVEAVVFLYPETETFRIGLGLRKSTSAKLSTSGAADMGNYDFDASLGTVLEMEWLTRRRFNGGQWGFNVRYVAEHYTLSGFSGGPSIDGSHLGLGVAYYF